MTAPPRSARRPWVAAWLGGAVIGTANGALREGTYGRRMEDLTAHQISTATGIAALAAYFAALERRWPLPSDREALEVGAAWLALTLGFEFGLGRLIEKRPWRDLVADYDLRRGRAWPLFLASVATGPLIARMVHRRNGSAEGPPAPER